jgi:hypothetical protein
MQVEAVVLGAQGALGDGAVVGVEHDAEGLALVGRTRGWAADDGCGKQSGEERVLFSEGLIVEEDRRPTTGLGKYLAGPDKSRVVVESCAEAFAVADAARARLLHRLALKHLPSDTGDIEAQGVAVGAMIRVGQGT